jgi:AcrR family transcriptional regulator
VAKQLGVTKPALYRYFRSKEELSYAMDEDYAMRLRDFVVVPLRARTKNGSDNDTGFGHLREVVQLYFESVFTFFDEHPFHYLYFIRTLLGRRTRSDSPVHDVFREHDALLLDLLDDGTGRTAEHKLLMLARYITTAAAFWTTEHYRSQTLNQSNPTYTFEPELFQLDRTQQKELIDAGTDHVVNGFLAETSGIETDTVERIAWIHPEELPERHRILDAITETVLAVGYGAATVERIAQRAGLSKSGLYHYFTNKDDMLTRTLLDAQRHFAGLARTRFAQLGTHTDRLYGLFVMIASYAHHDPSTIIVENWLRESNVEVNIPPEQIVEIQRIYAFVSEMLVEGQLAGDPDQGFSVLTYINFLVMQEMAGIAEQNFQKERITARIRALYNLFADGVAAALHDQGVETR